MNVLIYKPKKDFKKLKYSIEDVVEFVAFGTLYDKNYFILVKVAGELDCSFIDPVRDKDGSTIHRRGYTFISTKLKLKTFLRYFVKREIELTHKQFMNCIRSKK